MKGPTIVHWPFNSGQDQSRGERGPHTPAGTLYKAINLRRDADGSLEKRPGTEALEVSDRIALNSSLVDNSARDGYAVTSLSKRDQVPYVTTSRGWLCGLERGDSRQRFYFAGRVATVLPQGELPGFPLGGGPDVGYGISPAGIAVSKQGYVLVTASTLHKKTSNKTRALVISPNGQVTSQVKTSAAYRVSKAVSAGNSLFMVWQENATVRALEHIPDNNNTEGEDWENDTLLFSLPFDKANWDVARYDDSTWFSIHNAAPSGIFLSKMNGTTVVATGGIPMTGNATAACSVYANEQTGSVVVAYSDVSSSPHTARWVRLSAATLAQQSSGSNAVPSDHLLIGPPLVGPGPFAHQGSQDYRAVAAAVGPTGTSYGKALRMAQWDLGDSTLRYHSNVMPISKPAAGDMVWCITGHYSDTNARFVRPVLLRFSDIIGSASLSGVRASHVEASLPERLAPTGPSAPWGTATSQIYFNSVAEYSGIPARYAAVPDVVSVSSGAPFYQLKTLKYGRASDVGLSPLPSDHSVVFPGSPVVSDFSNKPSNSRDDTADVDEELTGTADLGFADRPTILTVSVNSDSTGLEVGTYKYRVTFERYGLRGEVIRSAPSIPVTAAVTSAGDHVFVAVSQPSIGASARFGSAADTDDVAPVKIVVWRTRKGGTTYFKAAEDFSFSSTTEAYTVTDRAKDSQLSDEILYTDGGVLDNQLPPTCRFMAKSEDRLWCGGLWDERVIQSSKIIVPGEVPAFSELDSFKVVFPDKIRALAHQDGSVVAFARNSIFVVPGDGPDDRGVGAFPPPRRIESNIGAIDHVGVLETSAGIIFRSERGFYLLPRGFGTPQFIGSAVKDDVASLSKCLSAAAFHGKGQHNARFLMSATGYGGTDVLTYNLENGDWYHDTYPTMLKAIGAWPDGYAMAASDFTTNLTYPMLYENENAAGDAVPTGSPTGGHFIQSKVKTTQVYPFGIAGEGVVNKVVATVEPLGVCDVRMSVYPEAFEGQSGAWNIVPTGPIDYLPIEVQQMRNTALQIEIEDSETSGAGTTKGVRMLGLSIEATQKPGVKNINPSRKR